MDIGVVYCILSILQGQLINSAVYYNTHVISHNFANSLPGPSVSRAKQRSIFAMRVLACMHQDKHGHGAVYTALL